MKKEFKVGDRVACRGYSFGGDYFSGEIGTITDISELINNPKPGETRVQFSDKRSGYFHSSQLTPVRLVRKKRREWWIVLNNEGGVEDWYETENSAQLRAGILNKEFMTYGPHSVLLLREVHRKVLK